MGRNGPGQRQEGNDGRVKNVISADLVEILDHFNIAIGSIKGQLKLASEMAGNRNEEKAEHIYRSLIVFLVSALDYYMHGLTGYGLCQIYRGEKSWYQTNEYDDLHLNLPIDFLKNVAASTDEDWLLNAVSYHYGRDSMVAFKPICKHLKLIGIDINAIAYEVFPEYIDKVNTEGKNAEEKKKEDKFKGCRDQLQKRLRDINKDRNIIAHQANRNYATRAIKKITKDDVEKYISDVEKIVKAINKMASRKE